MKNTILFFFGIIISIIIFAYCKHDPAGIDQLPEVCFEKQVLPIFQANCAMSGCHNAGGESFDFRTYSGIMGAISAGDPGGSEAYQAITTKWGQIMPPKGNNQLTAEQRTLIYVWISQGAKETKCSTDTNSTDTVIPVNDSICFQQKILPILSSSCALSGCHDQASAQGDIVLTSYSGLMTTGEERMVTAGNAAASKVIKVIKGAGEDLMPPSPKSPLTAKQIEWFTTWINDGALNSSCDSGCDTTDITFALTVNPILQNNCIGCHSGGNPSAGINLAVFSNITTIVNNGKLEGTIEHQTGFPLMPPSASLSECNIKQIQLWIQAGAQNNK